MNASLGSWVVWLLLLLCAGCAGSAPPPSVTDPTPASSPGPGDNPSPGAIVVEGIVGDQGAVLGSMGGLRLSVPAGALDANTSIRVSVAANGTSSSTEYRFEPDGKVFARPVTVELPLPSGMSAATLYWANGSGGYEPVGGTTIGNVVRAGVTHFSGGYAGARSATRTVSGTRFFTNLTSGRIYNDPRDVTNMVITAYVLRPDGTYDVHPGQGRVDGTFSIPNVPVGPYLLRAGNGMYVQTSEDVVDLGQLIVGRTNKVAVDMSRGMAVDYDLTNLAPWDDGRIDVFSPEANSWFWYASPTVPRGAQALQGLFNLLGAQALVPVYALDASLGDSLVVAQHSWQRSAQGFSYLGLSRVFESGPITAGNGVTARLQGAFADVAAAHQIAVDWDFQAFVRALTADANPRSIPYDGPFWNRFRVVGQPGGLAYGTYDQIQKADFLSVPEPLDKTVPSATQTGTMQYGSPLTGTWGIHWIASADRAVPIESSGTAVAWFMVSLKSMDLANGPSVSLPAPRLGLPRAPKIGGLDLFRPQVGVGLTPRLSWDPPVPGPADTYQVQVVCLTPSEAKPYRSIAFIQTSDTAITLPPGMLEAGNSYFAVIRAFRRGVRANAPNRIDLPLDEGVQVTESFSP